MARIKYILLLLAVCAVNMVASASAFASSAHIFFVNEAGLETSETIENVSSSGKLETKAFGIPIFIECDEDISSKYIIENEGKSEGGVQFKRCHVVEDSKGKKIFLTACIVSEPVEMKAKGELTSAGIDTLKGASSEESFAEIKIESETCALKGTYKIKGTESCAVPEAELEKATHEAICSPAGSKLVFGSGEKTEPAQLFDAELIKLKSSGQFRSAPHPGFDLEKGWSAEGKEGKFVITEEAQVSCEKETFEGVSPVSGFSEKMDMAPKYSGCQLEIKEGGTTKTNATVEARGCDYEYKNPEETGKDAFKSEFDISNCTGGEKGGVLITDSEVEKGKTCEVSLPDQATGKEDDEDTDKKEGPPFESEGSVKVTDTKGESKECPPAIEKGKEPGLFIGINISLPGIKFSAVLFSF
jgi:hypothetical protein